MELSKFIAAGILVLIVILVLIYHAIKQLIRDYKNNKRGKEGEAAIEKEIKQSGIPGNLFKNVYITFPNGNSTEVDLVFLTDKGIYVIESKNYSGEVTGTEEAHDWYVKYPNGNNYSLYSPILQNRGHINSLKYALRIDEKYFSSLIVFGEKAELKLTDIRTPVVKVDKLKLYLRHTYNNSPVSIDKTSMASIAQHLSTMVGANPVTKAKHKKNIQKKYK